MQIFLLMLKKVKLFFINFNNKTATVRAIKNLKVFVLNIDHLMEMINNGSNLINKTILSRIEENLTR